LSDWLDDSGLPTSVVRRSSFCGFLGPGVPPGYKPPSTEMLRKLQITNANRVKLICQEILQKRVTAATLTADGWTSASGGSYFGVLLHYVDSSNFMQTPLLLAVV
jgi:hypothetical protein